MRLGVFAKTFPGLKPLSVLQAARETRFDCVQWNMACSGLGALPMVVPEEAVRVLREAVEATGVGIAAVSATYNMIHPDRGVIEAGRAGLAAVAGAGRGMGTGYVTLCTGSRDAEDQWRHHPDNESPAAWEAFLAEMRLALRIAERAGVTLLVEPEPANVVSGPERALAMLDELGHPAALGILFDPANLSEAAPDGDAIDRAVEWLGPWVRLVHAKDRDAAGRVVPAGQGAIDFARLFARLRAVGFDGDVVTHGLTAEDAPGVARHLRRCLEAVM